MITVDLIKMSCRHPGHSKNLDGRDLAIIYSLTALKMWKIGRSLTQIEITRGALYFVVVGVETNVL